MDSEDSKNKEDEFFVDSAQLMTTTDPSNKSNHSLIFGKRYPIVLRQEPMVTFQYNLNKPLFVDHNKSGSLVITKSSDQAILSLKTNTDTVARFQGIEQNHGESANDRILVFDGNSFSLAKNSLEVQNLRYIRDEQEFSSKVTAIVTNHVAKASKVEDFRKRKRKERKERNERIVKASKTETKSSKVSESIVDKQLATNDNI